MNQLPKAESITHQHILCVINTLIIQKNTKDTIRILDAGCGNGKLIAYLHICLHLLHSDKIFHISGYDVQDHGVQSEGFLVEAVNRLSTMIPAVNWAERINTIQTIDQWTFVTKKYDFIISNQVLEHVYDKDLFFSNISSNLIDGGHSVHLAPLKHVVHEGHIFLPWAHRIRNFSSLYGYIRFMSSIGFGKFRKHQKETGCSLNEYSERHADYIYFWTNYSSEAETIDFARRNGMRADFRFSFEFFTSKIRQILKIKRRNIYKPREYGFIDAILVKQLRYLSSVTLVCTKKNTY